MRFDLLHVLVIVGLAAVLTTPVDTKASKDAATAEYRDVGLSGTQAPLMVRIPAGSFIQGSDATEVGRDPDEGPVRTVRIKAFALGKYEVTRGEFRAFIAATAYRTDAERNTPVPTRDDAIGCFTYRGGNDFNWKATAAWFDVGFEQDDTHPVGCISWNDANAYIAWLNRETGKQYRLPSEGELEYAIRAGSSTRWPWGDDAEDGCAYASFADRRAGERFPDWGAARCDDGYLFTSPVGSHKPNAFGIYDILGNVWEWAADCAHKTYNGAPLNGSAWTGGGMGECGVHVRRGGSWDDLAIWLRSANRSQDPSSSRFHFSGFRVAHD